MPIMPLSGSSTPQSKKLIDKFDDIIEPMLAPQSVSLPITDKDIPPDPTELDGTENKTDSTFNDPLVNYAYQNNQLDLYNFNSVTELDSLKNLIGYVRGSRIKVRYYSKQNSNGDIRSDINDSPNLRNVNTRVYVKIVDYEITLTGALQFSWDSDQTQGEIKGTAILYPGLTPQIGDRFISHIDTGQCVLFTIQSITPMSYQANRTVFTVEFGAFSHINQNELDVLEGSTIATKFFSKQNFLGQGFALLSEDRYLDSQKITQYKEILANYYKNEFFDNTLNLYALKRGHNFTYDPYIVEFINRIIPFDLLPYKSNQLLPQCSDIFKESIWNVFLQADLKSVLGVRKYARYKRHVPSIYSPFLNPLMGQTYIQLEKHGCEGLDTYIFSKAFYHNRLVERDGFESLVFRFIRKRSYMKSEKFIAEYLDKFDELPEIEQFYRIPIYFWMSNIVLASLSRATV